IRAVPPRPGVNNLVWIITAADAAVVSRERLTYVVVLVLQIESQNRATHPDVGRDADELVAAHAELFRPERHHLHEADRRGGGDGITLEAALDLDHTHDQSRREACLAGPVGLT